MSTNPPIISYDSPAIQSLIPLFYVAWADRILTPTEVSFLQKKVSELGFLSPTEKAIISNWSDPTQPPSRELFKQWEIEIKRVSCKMPIADRKSLVNLGLAMARRSAQQNPDTPEFNYASPETRTALEGLEKHLGLIDQRTYHSIFEDEAQAHQKEVEVKKATFDIAKMQALLDDDYAEIRNELKTLLKDPVFKYRTLRNKDEYRAVVLEWTKLLCERGYGALAFPKEYGGEDDMGKYAAVFETLGYHDLSLTIKFGVQVGLFGGSINWLGTKRHHDKYLKDAGTADLLGCFAMTETGHGSNVRQLETTATYDPRTDELIVNSPRQEAGKEYIGNALHSHMASVFCQLIVKGKNHGVHAVVVPIRNKKGQLLPRVRVEDNGYKLGLNGVDNGRLWFDNIRVPRENLLNRFGDITEDGEYTSPIENPSRRFFTMLGTLVGGRVCVPQAGLSAAKSAIAIAVRYALKRRQFGRNFTDAETLLLDYPSHQQRLMPLVAKAYALDFALTYLTERFVKRSPEDMREIETLAAGMKAYATWFATAAIQECREACGGKGYLAENRFADLKADTDIFTTFEGDNTVLMLLVAKGVLTAFKQEFNEEGMMGILRYVGTNISTAIAEKNPLTIRNTDKEHLLDSDFHQQAFAYRRRSLMISVSNRLRGKIKAGTDSYTAALECQPHMLVLAEAFVEQLVLEKFVEQVQQTEDTTVKKALQELCQLYALDTLQKHKGWYLEKEYFAPAKTKAIRHVFTELCATTRQNAMGLVQSYGIPEELLAAEIVVG